MDEISNEITAQLTRVRQEMAKLLELLGKVQAPVAPAKKTTARKQ